MFTQVPELSWSDVTSESTHLKNQAQTEMHSENRG